ncbi:heme exporter protein A [Endobacter medicaginis]|uniref:Heme exporter protein A n=1 Tax=Endobacter medicaginis TaxID=1181271 RepID=A0A839UV08_9PROT|nr:heme exporter protein A [Endobacter medicaginis]
MPVIEHLDLDLEAGGALLLSGCNGAGKTTLLRTLAGLLRPRSGTIRLGGETLADAPPRGWLGHADALKPALTACENLAFAACHHRDRNAAIEAALARLDLAALAEMPARMLSAGQRRRLALARLSLSPARLWLLDEPSVGLDAVSVARLGALLADHRAAGGMIVASSHVALPLPGAAGLVLG